MFLIIASCLYFLSRFYRLLSLPIFIDEALYLRMTQDLIHKGQIWISFSDGKEPLFFWVQSLFLRIFADPLLGGRFFAVLSGWVLMVVGYKLIREIFDHKIARIFTIFYLVSPFVLFYNRLALIDTFLTLLLSSYILFLVRLARKPNLKLAIAVSLFLYLSLLTKTIAWLYILVIPIAFLAFSKRSILLHWPVVVLAVAFIFYLPLTLIPGYWLIWLKNQNVFTYSFTQAIFGWRTILLPNLKMSSRDWWLIYFGFIPFMGVLAAGVYGLFKRKKSIIFLFFLMIFPWLAESAIAKIFFPRYLLFISIPIFAICSYLITRRFLLILLLIFLWQPAILTIQLLTGPEQAKLPIVERWQYFESWPSGYGTNQLVDYLKSNPRPIVVTESYGLNEILKLAFYDNKDVTIKTFENLNEKLTGDYLVLGYYQKPPPNWSVSEIASFCKVECKEKIRLYEIKQ